LSAWFLFSGDLNVDFSDFIFVKIYSKFDVRKQKLSLNHKDCLVKRQLDLETKVSRTREL